MLQLARLETSTDLLEFHQAVVGKFRFGVAVARFLARDEAHLRRLRRRLLGRLFSSLVGRAFAITAACALVRCNWGLAGGEFARIRIHIDRGRWLNLLMSSLEQVGVRVLVLLVMPAQLSIWKDPITRPETVLEPINL